MRLEEKKISDDSHFIKDSFALYFLQVMKTWAGRWLGINRYWLFIYIFSLNSKLPLNRRRSHIRT